MTLKLTGALQGGYLKTEYVPVQHDPRPTGNKFLVYSRLTKNNSFCIFNSFVFECLGKIIFLIFELTVPSNGGSLVLFNWLGMFSANSC